MRKNTEAPLLSTINSILTGREWINPPLNFKTMSSPLSDLWYNYYQIIQEDAPELVDEYLENTAARLELTVDYFTAEFL